MGSFAHVAAGERELGAIEINGRKARGGHSITSIDLFSGGGFRFRLGHAFAAMRAKYIARARSPKILAFSSDE